MKTRLTIGFFAALISAPCLAGDLEDGVRLHEQGRYTQALHAFEKAARRGNAEAQRRLGFMYYHGEGVVQDNQRAVALFETAGDAGDILSASNLGMMYEHGMGVAQSDARAAAWVLKAAEMGDPQSQFNASIMFYKGQGVAQDRVEAAKWWTLAMLHGGAVAQRVRSAVESAQGKLTPEQNAEGGRRAQDWLAAHKTRP